MQSIDDIIKSRAYKHPAEISWGSWGSQLGFLVKLSLPGWASPGWSFPFSLPLGSGIIYYSWKQLTFYLFSRIQCFLIFLVGFVLTVRGPAHPRTKDLEEHLKLTCWSLREENSFIPESAINKLKCHTTIKTTTVCIILITVDLVTSPVHSAVVHCITLCSQRVWALSSGIETMEVSRNTSHKV